LAANLLNWSRFFALASVVALAVAVGVTWLNAKDEPAAPAKTLILDSEGVRVCGTLMRSSAPGQLTVLEKGKMNATVVAVSDVKAVGAIAACPGE
jgi:hypothetical protein